MIEVMNDPRDDLGDDDGQVKTAFTPSQALMKMLLMLVMTKIKITLAQPGPDVDGDDDDHGDDRDGGHVDDQNKDYECSGRSGPDRRAPKLPLPTWLQPCHVRSSQCRSSSLPFPSTPSLPSSSSSPPSSSSSSSST